MANFGVNAQYDWANGIVQLPLADPFNQHFGDMGAVNGPNREYPIAPIQALAWALLKLDVSMPDQLDNLFYGLNGITCGEAFLAIGQSYTAGFRHTVVLQGGTRLAFCNNVLREAFGWALLNVASVRIIRPGGFYALPPLQGGGNPPRVRMAYPLLADETTGLLWGVADLIALTGCVHDPASRGAQSRFSLAFDTIIDALDTPPTADQAVRVARSIIMSGVPCFLRVYPESMAQRYAAIQVRLYYIGGTFTQRREVLATMLPLMLKRLITLRSFLVPSVDVSQSVEAYRLMVVSIHPPGQPRQESTLFTFEVAEALDVRLADFPQVIVDAQAPTPPLDAAWRSQEAVAEHHRREQMVNNAPASGGQSTAGGTGAVAVSRALKQQLCNTLMTLPFFGPAQADVVRLYANNPQNDLPVYRRSVKTRNVFIYQVMIGKVRGVADAAPMFSILEGLQPGFERFVTYMVVMDKAPLPTAGARKPHTLSFEFPPSTLAAILSNDREKFLAVDWLKLAASIKSAREHLPPIQLKLGINMFESAENIPLLRHLQHFLDVFDYAQSGVGSLSEGLNRIEQFRQNGAALPGEAYANHLANTMTAWQVLLGDLFDSMSQFCCSREAPQVSLLLSDRIYEAGGSFDELLKFQDTATQSLNSMIMLHPAFGSVFTNALGGSSGAGSSSGATAAQTGSPSDSKNKNKTHRAGGNLYYGQGNKGPAYNIALVMAEIQKIKQVNQGNFCLEFYLSTSGFCPHAKHHKNCAQHKWPAAVTALRDSLEHRPFRVDAKALPKK